MRAIFLISLLSIILTDCRQAPDQPTADTKTSRGPMLMAERIKIDELEGALTKLRNGQTEFPFIGITSNGVDCIYFMPENGKFNIDFEAVSLDQVPYITKLKDFSDSNKFESSVTTYNNEAKYVSDKPAPVIHIETSASPEDAAKLGEKIQTEIFKNNKDTVYEVVP